jgi:peptidoglycan/LPS O-acetylase OafA/YrhL
MPSYLGSVSRDRVNNIDFLRFFLAALVIFSHSYPLLLGSNTREPMSLATQGQRTGGELAVEGFFILSGFLITSSWFSARGLGDYLRRRALRIYPGFLMAICFSGLIAAPLLQESAAEYWRSFSWRNFLLEGINLNLYTPPSHVTVNGSLWSIRFEFLCYLAVAGLGLCGLLSRRSLILLAWLVCSGLHAGQIYFHLQMYGSRLSWLYGFPGMWPRLMSNFLAGCLFYCYRDRIVLSWPLLGGAVLGLLTLGVLAPGLRAFPLAVPLLGAYVLFFAAYLPVGRLQHFASRGDFSYGLYLYAFPVQQLLVRALRPWLNAGTLFLLALGATLVLAVMSWRFIESPFLRLKKSSRPNKARPGLAMERIHQPSVTCVPIPIEGS